MKKTINLFKSTLLAAALVFSFAACTNDAETSSNELAGKTFSYSNERWSDSISFTDDTLTITATRQDSLFFFDKIKDESIEIDNITRKSVETYTYSVENDPDYLVCKLKKRESYYLKDDKVVCDRSLSENLNAYTEEQRNFLEAILPEGTSEEVIKAHLYDDIYINVDKSSLNEELYQEYKKVKAKDFEIEKKFNFLMPYKMEGSNLNVCDEYFVIGVPQGLKIGDIFNEHYEYEAKEAKGWDITITPYTVAGRSAIITINNESKAYTILSATNDKIKIAEAEYTGLDKFGYYTVDTNNPITCNVTYKEGENKTYGTIDIKGEKYTFDIQYLTNETLDKYFKEGDGTMKLKQK